MTGETAEPASESAAVAAPGQAAAGSPTSGTAAKSSRYRGVRWIKKRRKWRAEIKIGGKQRHLGSFDDEDDAARAYAAACRELGRD
eukprot:COSAG04_NODE_22482_length_354_cov_0.792157_1_plen_85_part_10